MPDQRKRVPVQLFEAVDISNMQTSGENAGVYRKYQGRWEYLDTTDYQGQFPSPSWMPLDSLPTNATIRIMSILKRVHAKRKRLGDCIIIIGGDFVY